MGCIKLWRGWFISLEKKKDSEPTKPQTPENEFAHFEKPNVIERKKANHKDYELMIKEIQKNFPVGDIFENPLDCAFFLRIDADGFEDPSSIIKNYGILSEYRNRRSEECMRYLGLKSIPHVPNLYVHPSGEKYIMTSKGFKKKT